MCWWMAQQEVLTTPYFLFILITIIKRLESFAYSMALSFEWELFTVIASILLYNGYSLTIPGDRMLRFGVSFIFWIGSLSLWISNGGGFVPMLALIAPTLLSLVWLLQSMGETTEQKMKKDIYSVY